MRRAFSLIFVCIAIGRVIAQQPNAAPSTGPTTTEHRYLVHAACKDKPFALERASTTIASEDRVIKDFSITSASALPLRYALLLDISGSTRPASSFIAQSAPRVIRALDNLGGEGVLGVFDESVEYDDQKAAGNRVTRLMRQSKMRGTSALYDSLFAAVNTLPKKFPLKGDRRYTLFVITDAEDNQSTRTLAAVVAAAIKQGVAIYPIILRIFEKKGLDKARGALERAAVATGGAWFDLAQMEEFDKDMKAYMKAQQVLTFSADFQPRDIVITSSKCESLGVALTAASRP